MAFAVAVLAVSWLAVLLVDLLNVLGTRDRLAASEMERQAVWQHLFNDQPVEWLQWVALASTGILAGVLGGISLGRGEQLPARFWLVFGAGVSLMLLEDAGDIRHVMADWVERISDSGFPDSFQRGAPAQAFDMVYLGALGAVPLYALFRYRQGAWHVNATRRYLIVGFVAYGIAATASTTSQVGQWYWRAGEFVNERVAGGQMVFHEEAEPGLREFLFVDGVLEESVELVGAAAILAATVAYLLYLLERQKEPQEGNRGSPGNDERPAR